MYGAEIQLAGESEVGIKVIKKHRRIQLETKPHGFMGGLIA